MTYDPDGQEEQRHLEREELLERILLELKAIRILLQEATGTEVDPNELEIET